MTEQQLEQQRRERQEGERKVKRQQMPTMTAARHVPDATDQVSNSMVARRKLAQTFTHHGGRVVCFGQEGGIAVASHAREHLAQGAAVNGTAASLSYGFTRFCLRFT